MDEFIKFVKKVLARIDARIAELEKQNRWADFKKKETE